MRTQDKRISSANRFCHLPCEGRHILRGKGSPPFPDSRFSTVSTALYYIYFFCRIDLTLYIYLFLYLFLYLIGNFWCQYLRQVVFSHKLFTPLISLLQNRLCNPKNRCGARLFGIRQGFISLSCAGKRNLENLKFFFFCWKVFNGLQKRSVKSKLLSAHTVSTFLIEYCGFIGTIIPVTSAKDFLKNY